MKDPLWEGVYSSFSDVPAEGSGFAGGDWLDNSTSKLESFKSLAASAATVPRVTAYTDSLLPVIAGIVQGKNRSARILDFGGGLGFSYYQVKQAIADSERLQFCVVDIEQVCEAGRQLFEDEPAISFHSTTSEIADQQFDIVHIGSSLQYIEDWQNQLATLCKLAPEYVLMANIPAGDIETFATAQNYYGSKIPCWFFNVADLIDAMQRQGYSAIFRSTYATKVYGVEQPYPLDNFDEAHQVEYPCMLLFQRTSNQSEDSSQAMAFPP